MNESIPSPKRVALLALIAASIFGLGSAATFTVMAVAADRQALADAETIDASAVIMEMADRFELLAMADPFLLPAGAAGDAAEVYWPASGAGDEACAGRNMPTTFDATAIQFERWPEKMEAAARCSRIDDMVRAARLPELDMAGHFRESDSGFDFFESYEIFREPHQALTALIARAHSRIRGHDYRNAERDARAAVSAGRQFVWNSPDVGGISFGLMLMTSGLDHLRVIHERRGEAGRSALALKARDSVGEVQKRWHNYLDVGRNASTFPKLIRYAVAAAENEGLPLGVRNTIVVFLGYGHVGHFTERVFGPSRARARALQRLESDPDLSPAVAQARKGLELSWRERRDLATQWSL